MSEISTYLAGIVWLIPWLPLLYVPNPIPATNNKK